jgi:hypothetical protein
MRRSFRAAASLRVAAPSEADRVWPAGEINDAFTREHRASTTPEIRLVCVPSRPRVARKPNRSALGRAA